MLNKSIHYITTLFVLESFILSVGCLKKKKSASETASLLEKKSVSLSRATKNQDRCITSIKHAAN